MSKHFINLDPSKPQTVYPGGSRTAVTCDEISTLVNISFSIMKLNKGGCHEALWHPNAHKIGYCQEGSALISAMTPTSQETFTITEGDIFYVPKGYVYYIANAGEKECVLAFGLSHEKPDELTLSKAILSLPDSVFAATFKTSPSFFEGLKKNRKEKFVSNVSLPKLPSNISSRFKFNIKTRKALLNTKWGYLKAATKPNLPILEDLAILGFGLNAKGVVEPHWHTNAGELVYIVSGRARMTVLAPDGSVDVGELKGPAVGFAPASHFHSIENIGNENVEVIAFFSHAEPNYIGIGESLHLVPNELLAETFNVSPNYFDELKSPAGPVVICGA
jgi:oxalate decarboxylase